MDTVINKPVLMKLCCGTVLLQKQICLLFPHFCHLEFKVLRVMCPDASVYINWLYAHCIQDTIDFMDSRDPTDIWE